MNKGKKNKRNILLIVYALCSLAAFMAEIYFMINYKKEYVIIVAIGLVFLTSVGFLLEELFDNILSKPVDNNMEDLLKVQKASYLQGKNLTEEINRLFEEGIDSITQAFESNTKAIIDNEKSVAKVIIKKNDESNEKIRDAVKEIDLSKIPVPEINIPEISVPEIKLPEMFLSASDNSAAIESAKNEIISLIERLSAQVQNSAKLEDIVELREMLSKGLENVSVENVAELVEEVEEAEPEVEINVSEESPIVESVTIAEDFDINAENTFDDLFKDLADEITDEPIPEQMPVIEEMTVGEMPLIMDEMPEEPEPKVEEPVVEELSVEEPIIEEPVIDETLVEDIIAEMPVVEDTAVEEPVIEESAPTVDADPNKQLSADEIAALFASIQ